MEITDETLPDQARQRVAAVIAARATMPDLDFSDTLMLARYILTASAEEPSRDNPYPHASGDVTVLGPEIFSSTTVPAENTVICWRGENFIPDRPADTSMPDLSGAQAAPSAGEGWKGRVG